MMAPADSEPGRKGRNENFFDRKIAIDTSRQSGSTKKWWQTESDAKSVPARPRKGQACPKCLMDDLDYDTLFRLSCPVCGYVADCGAFT